MTKKEVFAIIKDANNLVDEQKKVQPFSKAYYDLNDAIGYTLDALTYDRNKHYTMHLSQRTGHYYVRYFE